MTNATVESVQSLVQIESGDRQLLAAIAEATAEAARRSGDWLVCRAGCTACCMGPFAITLLDARRLRQGLAALALSDPQRAIRVQSQAAAYTAAIAGSGEDPDEDGLPQGMDDVPCPALDPQTGYCDLYEWRPVTCRTFGPVTRTADGALGACELCYQGASDAQIAECEVDMDPQGMETGLLSALERAGERGTTTVAAVLQGD